MTQLDEECQIWAKGAARVLQFTHRKAEVEKVVQVDFVASSCDD
jgi:hypothetical protein